MLFLEKKINIDIIPGPNHEINIFWFLISPFGDFLQKFLYIYLNEKNPVGKNLKKNIGKRENLALFQQITNGSHKKTC